MSTTRESSYTLAGKYCPFVEFQLDEHRRRTLSTGQLIEFRLDPNPDAEDDKTAPRDKLALMFSTADVVLLGWRLEMLSNKLRENDVATVRILPKRYAELDGFACVVTSIEIKSIEKP